MKKHQKEDIKNNVNDIEKNEEEDIFLDEDIGLSYKDRVMHIIKNLDLDTNKKKIIIKNRFLYEVIEYEKKRDKCFNYSCI